MKTTMLIVVTLLYNGCSLHAQLDSMQLDTCAIYKNKAGIGFDIYMHIWFNDYGWKSSFSYRSDRMNKQDSIVTGDHPHYFRVFDTDDVLMFEGRTEVDGNMIGDVKYYYPTGVVKRIEHWDNSYYGDTCGPVYLNESPGPEGTWKYYRKDGSLEKEISYEFQMKSCDPFHFRFIKRTSCFSASGKVKSQRIRRIKSR